MLVELLRIKCMDEMDNGQRYYRMKTSPTRSIKAGRAFASQCNADPSKETYGLEDILLMQETLDREHPLKYTIEVYTYKNKEGHIKKVFGDTTKRSQKICLLMIEVNGKPDFFGLHKCTRKILKEPWPKHWRRKYLSKTYLNLM